MLLVWPVFLLTYLGFAAGSLPGLRLNRAGIAVIGALAMLGIGALSLREAAAAIDWKTIGYYLRFSPQRTRMRATFRLEPLLPVTDLRLYGVCAVGRLKSGMLPALLSGRERRMRVGWLLIVALLCSVPLLADDDTDAVHLAAHFGLSYALEIGTYGLASRTFHLDEADSLILSVATTFTIGLIRQMIAAGSGPMNTRGLWQNALGIGAAVGTVYAFDF